MLVYTSSPYAKTVKPMVTLPLMVLTPLMSHAKVPLFGVKVTSKRVALKLLLSWHGFREEEVSMFSAAESGIIAAPAKAHNNDLSEGAMMGEDFVVGVMECVDVVVC